MAVVVDGEVPIRRGGTWSAAVVLEAEVGDSGARVVGVSVCGEDGGDDGVGYLIFCVVEDLVSGDDRSVVIEVRDVESDVDGRPEVGTVV